MVPEGAERELDVKSPAVRNKDDSAAPCCSNNCRPGGEVDALDEAGMDGEWSEDQMSPPHAWHNGSLQNLDAAQGVRGGEKPN